MFNIKKTAKIFLLAFIYCFLPSPTKGQEVTPDGTTATSVNIADGTNFDINGGDRAGGNLFHSFGNFGVPTGGSANFLNSPDVENIINRVTGGNVSSIDGLLKANGSANLFLINPAGIIFGQNARLDIGGSFLGSTADSLLFNDGTEFSAVNATGKPLLTINAPIGLNFRDTPGDITVRNNGQGTRSTGEVIDTLDALRVDSDKTFALVGGNVTMEGATIKTAGGRIEIGSVTSPSVVNLTPVAKGWQLGYEGVKNFGDIQLLSNTAIDASGLGAGDVRVQVRRITLKDGGSIETSILGSQPGGSLEVNGIESVEIDGAFPTGLFAQVNPIATGNGSSITVNTGNLKVNNGASISTSSFGRGNAGNVTINASDLVSFDGNDSGIFSNLAPEGIGSSGNIDINATNVSVTNGARFSSDTFGQGNAGNVTINAEDTIFLDGDRSGVLSRVTPEGLGNAGNIDIKATNVSVTNGAQFSSNTFGQGNAGNITIKAGDTVSFDGTTPQKIPSAVFTTVEAGAKGKGGDINITANNLSLTNGGELNAFVREASKDLPGGQGDAGSVNLNIGNNLSIAGISESGLRSGIFSLVGRGAIGRGGDINIAARNFSIADGARLVSSTDGEGDAGNITINATNSVSLENSRLFTGMNFYGIGKGGNIDIITPTFSMVNGAELASSTDGIGDAGNITINAANSVFLNSSNLFTDVLSSGIGNAGSIDIITSNLSITNGAELASSTNGEGNAGNIIINSANSVFLDNSNFSSEVDDSGIGKGGDINITTNNLALDNSAKLSSETSGEGEGGNIDLQAFSISMKNESELEASTTGSSNAGNITINTTDNLSLNNSEISNNTFFGKGNAGNININTKNLSLTNNSNFFNFVGLSSGAAGKIEVNATDNISLSNSSDFLSGSLGGSGTGSAGEIIVSTKNLFLTERSSFYGNSFVGKKDAGNIKIKATDTISLNDSNLFNSSIFAEGKGGSIEIIAKNLSLTNNSSVDSSYIKDPDSVPELGGAGNINIRADALTLNNSSISATTDSGEGGNINLKAGDILSLRNSSEISALAEGNADGGNITIDADTIVAFPNQNNDIIASAEKGDGGKIDIETQGIFGLKERKSTPVNRTNDIDASSQFGLAGNVFINNINSDPTQGLVQSTENVVEPDETVSQACSGSGDIAGNNNSFTIVGRGGLPQAPTEPLNSTIIAGDSGTKRAEEKRGRGAEENNNSSLEESESVNAIESKTPIDSNDLVPARGMMINEKGQVVLTRYPTPNASDRSISQSNSCSERPTLSEEVDRVRGTNKNNLTFKNQTPTGYIFPDNYLVGFN
jgi:filamentous hemagglutinin family protein